MAKTIINKHRSIIFLNGTFPHPKLIQALNIQVPLIAADGAANTMQEYNLSPTYIVGDGDSYTQQQGHGQAKMIAHEDQNFTDFEKCIAFARDVNLLPALVLGMSGGEIDHVLGNMQALVKHGQGKDLYFLDTYVQRTSSTQSSAHGESSTKLGPKGPSTNCSRGACPEPCRRAEPYFLDSYVQRK